MDGKRRVREAAPYGGSPPGTERARAGVVARHGGSIRAAPVPGPAGGHKSRPYKKGAARYGVRRNMWMRKWAVMSSRSRAARQTEPAFGVRQ